MGLEFGLVTLHVDDDVVVGEGEQRRGLSESAGAVEVVDTGEEARGPEAMRCILDLGIIGGDDDAGWEFRLLGLLPDVLNEGLAGSVSQDLSRKARRSQAGGNDGHDLNHGWM